MESTPRRIIVGMPAYNEDSYIGSLVLQAQQYADEVIVVDDGSGDHTSKVAKLAGATVIRHTKNEGVGRTIQSIFAEAKRRQPDTLVILDADSQHDPEEIPLFIKAVSQGFDLVIGSRKAERRKIPFYRRVGQRILSYLTGVLSRRELYDTESGYRAYSKKAIAVLELKEKGMAICAEIIAEATSKGLRVTEIPISAIYTKDGSTLNPVRHGLGVLNRIMVMISERRPLLFFGLFGGIFLVLGLAAGGVVVRAYYYTSSVLATGTALISILLITIGMLTMFTGIILDVLNKRLSDSLRFRSNDH